MAKKRKPLPPKKKQTSELVRVDDLLRLAEQQLQNGQSALSLQTIERLLKLARTQSERDVANQILQQACLEEAMKMSMVETQTYYLNRAQAAGADRLTVLYYQALARWRIQDLDGALAAFEAVAQALSQPGAGTFPHLTFFRALAHLADARAWSEDGLAAPEINTLNLIKALLQKKADAQRQSLLDQPLLGDAQIWRALVALCNDAGQVDLDRLAAHIEQAQGRQRLVSILHYLYGITAMQQGKPEIAKSAWSAARDEGWRSPSAAKNLDSLLRAELIELAEAQQWQEIVTQAESYSAEKDAIWSEIVGTAYFHLGWEASQAGDWQLAAKQWRLGNEIWGNRYLAQNLALAEEAVEDWEGAASAWREMIRRRLRKKDHPDYLSDDQVAAIWEHIGDCYLRDELYAEALPCFQNAIKYRPEDTRLRLRLVDGYLDEDRIDAAENELQRILHLDEKNVEALVRLGSLYKGRWDRAAVPVWKRVLVIDPNHPDVKRELADAYIDQAERMPFYANGRHTINILQEGLATLPGNPQLLLRLGIEYRTMRKHKEAQQALIDAYQSAPQDLNVVSAAMHELLHLPGGDKTVENWLPDVRQIPGLPSSFWLDQANSVFGCKLNEKWAQRFCDEALALAERPGSKDTRSGVLIDIYEVMSRNRKEALAAHYRKRIEAEAAESGAVEYVNAYDLNFKQRDPKAAKRMMRKARQKARKAGDTGVEQRAEIIEQLLSGPFSGAFGGGPLDMARVLERLFGEDDDEFPDF